MEPDTLKKSFSHLLPAGMSSVGLGRHATSRQDTLAGLAQIVRSQGVGDFLCAPKLHAALELGPTGKGPLGFFPCLLS